MLAEFARFNRLADSWWDQDGAFWPLHGLNRLRSGYLCDCLGQAQGRDASPAQPLSGVRLLDVGCGGGLLSEAMARAGASVTGIDVVPRNIAIAERHAQQSGLKIHYQCVEAEALAASGARFDVVLNMEVVEHVPDPVALLDACVDLLSPRAFLAVATLNRTFRSYLAAIVGAEYMLGLLPRGTHRWRRFLRPEEIEMPLTSRGLVTMDRVGVRLNPFTRRFRLAADMSVNYMLLFRREAGLDSPSRDAGW